MPASRSVVPFRHLRSSTAQNLQQKQKASSATTAPEIININANASRSSSSSSRNTPSGSSNPMSSERPTTARTRPSTISHEVIEISSDDDDDLPAPVRHTSVAPSNTATAELRREMRKLREEKKRYKHEAEALHCQLEHQRQKVRSLEIQQSIETGKLALGDSDLDDIVSCNICTHTMFVPYILCGCGHTFCQRCITEWFDATLRNFLATHPHYNPNQPIPMQVAQLMMQPHVVHGPQVMAYIQANTPPQPQYTCPECRAPVKSPPIENFGMKSLAQMVATARREAIPPAPPRPRNGDWDAFFPARR